MPGDSSDEQPDSQGTLQPTPPLPPGRQG